jgi:hypothetical protein
MASQLFMPAIRKGTLKGGIIWRIWYWKKDEKKKAKLEAKQRKYDIMYNISLVFTPKTIGKYVPLTGQELDDFIILYTPERRKCTYSKQF